MKRCSGAGLDGKRGEEERTMTKTKRTTTTTKRTTTIASPRPTKRCSGAGLDFCAGEMLTYVAFCLAELNRIDGRKLTDYIVWNSLLYIIRYT